MARLTNKQLIEKYVWDGIDQDGDTFMINLKAGFMFTHDMLCPTHTRGCDTMTEVYEELRNYVIPCTCQQCQDEIVRGECR